MPQEVYLIMITAEANHNKYYHMIPCGDSFRVEYGRVGAAPQVRTYPIYEWDKKYNEKIRKGYVDQTAVRIVDKPKQRGPVYKDIKDPSVAELVRELRRCARQMIQAQYEVTSDTVTRAMVEKAEQVLNSLMGSKTLRSFNETLLELFRVIPRKMSHVEDNLASSKDDFGSIIDRERDILDVMAGQVAADAIQKAAVDMAPDDENLNKTILDVMGLTIKPATKADIARIRKQMGDISQHFDCAWRVVNKKTQAEYDKFLASHPIATKLLWHGSKNENWWSILNTGLVLRPQAAITGKMFGNGIYFAPKARKSLGYTSLHGSYWAGGNSDHAYMALFEIGYGTPHDVYKAGWGEFNGYDYDRLKKDNPSADCLHAHAGVSLRNDEIIIYREDQLTIRYLVRIK